jgi:cytochrome c-type biogenesis protein CcmE
MTAREDRRKKLFVILVALLFLGTAVTVAVFATVTS